MISKLPAGLDPGQRGHGPSMFSFVLETEPGKEFVAMKAREIMTTPAVSIGPLAKVHEVARLLVDSDISAVPVVDIQMRVLGMVSEGDLVRRKELRTQKRRSWWLERLTSGDTLASDYTKSHTRDVRDVMSTPVISVSEDTSLADIADILEEHRIKRVPVVKDGTLVGIVSRGDLVRELAASARSPAVAGDKSIRKMLLQRLKAQPWANASSLNFVVTSGIVDLNGIVPSAEQRRALRVLAETVPGVLAVKDRLVELPLGPAGP